MLDLSAMRVAYCRTLVFPARGRQHARHSCRAGCIVVSENPQRLVNRSARATARVRSYPLELLEIARHDHFKSVGKLLRKINRCMENSEWMNCAF